MQLLDHGYFCVVYYPYMSLGLEEVRMYKHCARITTPAFTAHSLDAAPFQSWHAIGDGQTVWTGLVLTEVESF
jgi:hypothetical protein